MPKCYESWWHNEYKEFIPCGKCENCRKRAISAWSVRLLWEQKKCISSNFITLTYDSKSLPVSASGYSTLCKRDVQLFFKRLRKAHAGVGKKSERTIKYFCVGEYGGKIGRPHYHIILFNADVTKIQEAWSQRRWYINKVEAKRRSSNSRGEKGALYRIVKKAVRQHNGQIHYGDSRGVTEASVGYCLKYMMESKDDSAAPPDYDVEKEFRLMSKGLGVSYLNAQNMRWHHEDLANRMYMEIELGRKVAMPRYYKERIYNKKEKVVVKESSQHRMVDKLYQDLFTLYSQDFNKYHRESKARRESARHRVRLLKIKNKKKNYAKAY